MLLHADLVDTEHLNPSIAYSDRLDDYTDGCLAGGTSALAIGSPLVQQLSSWANRSPTGLRESRMPATTGPGSLLAPLPSFMSVFGNGVNTQEDTKLDGASKIANINKRPLPNNHCSSPTLRRDSASTLESTDSSPTTTVSTMDSSLTEPSPSSSPESPQSAAPLSRFGPTFGTAKPSSIQGMDDVNRPSTAFASLPGLNRGDSPNKKMRNMKNLSVNTSATSRGSSQTTSSTFQPNTSTTAKAHAFSAPPTPAFIVPSKPARRRPSNLGLKISTVDDNNNSSATSHPASAVVPPTPFMNPQFRTLDYLQSSTTTPMISSPTVAPEGGMRLPPFGGSSSSDRVARPRPPLSMSHRSHENNHGFPITKQTLDHVQEENDYELPLSREAKSPAYPQGPVCIYDPCVYLYLEPTDSEASHFDVVLNVAREVKNPFTATVDKAVGPEVADAAVQVELSNGDVHRTERESLSEPHTAISDRSFSSAFETQPEECARTTPSTSKTVQHPEYIHILWDHNTNVVDDLLRLCELIDDRSRKGKKVLVHCQCGVSRSASLVVAYGLYKNPSLTVQEAYDAVKNRSRWIGPNMNLIYQLSEFKSKLPKSLAPGQASWHSWRDSGRSNPNAKSPDLRVAMPSSNSINDAQPGQLSAPFRKDLDLTPARANSFSPTNSALPELKSTTGDITPGPSSAPPDMQWSPSGTPLDRAAVQEKDPFDNAVPENAEEKEQVRKWHALQMDLDTTTAPLSAPASTEAKPNTTAAPFSFRANSDLNLPPPPTPSSTTPLTPSLPAGFSSLSNRRAAAPRQLPFRFEPPRSTPIFIAHSFRADLPLSDEPPLTPSLLSPRAAEFTASPFHRTSAGDLAGSSIAEQQAVTSPKPQDEDPRSPAERGGAPIVRSIFDVL